jgi:hypothetical protein
LTPASERCGAQTLLQDRLGFGELRLGVDAAHVVTPVSIATAFKPIISRAMATASLR